MSCYVGDTPDKCTLVWWSDADFASDLQDSKSTSGGYLMLIGPKTSAPITWLCKKQGAVSHSSTEAELIALDAGLRTEAIPALMLWNYMLRVFCPEAVAKHDKVLKSSKGKHISQHVDKVHDLLENIDYIPPSLPSPTPLAKLKICEDNDAVLKLLLKRRHPKMKHVGRTHRVDLDFLHQVMADPSITARYVNTKEQLADIFTKASFSFAQWTILCKSMQIGVTSISSLIAKKEKTQSISLHALPGSTKCGGGLTRRIGGNILQCLVMKSFLPKVDSSRF